MSGIFSSDWIVVILGFLTIGFNMVLNKLKENEGPVLGIRSVQAVLVVLLGLIIYSVYLMFAG